MTPHIAVKPDIELSDQSIISDLITQIIATVESGTLLAPSMLSDAKTGLSRIDQRVAFESFISALPALAPRLQWIRYSIQRDQIAQNVEEHWSSLHSDQESNFQEAVESIVKETEKVRTSHTDLRRQLRELERHLGFSDELLDTISAIFSPAPPSWERSESLARLLPAELLPAVDSVTYDHTLHQIVDYWLTAIGKDFRRNEQVIRLMGHGLRQLFPSEDDRPEGSFSFVQLCLLADQYLHDNPHDPIGVIWRGELAYWQGEYEMGDDFARQFWNVSGSCSSQTNSNVLRVFSRLSEHLKEEFSWTTPDAPGHLNHISDLKSVWIDREESLATAFVRRCIASGNWNTDLILAVNELNHSLLGFEFDVLPPAAWAWLAENDCDAVDGQLFYYQAWQRAFLLSADNIESPPSLLSSIVVLAGQILRQEMWTNKTNIPAVIDRFQQLLRSKHREMAVQSIAFAGHVVRESSPRHLTAADRLAIHNAFEGLEEAIANEPEDDEAIALADNIVALHYESEIAESETACQQLFGDQLWSVLSARTRMYITRGHLYYLKEQELPGEEGDFASTFFQLSNGLLNELHERFTKRLFGNRDIKKKAQDALGQNDSRIEWGSLSKLLEKMNAGTCDAVVNFLIASHVRVDSLIAIRSEIDTTLKRMRNATAHGERIDREQATLLYDNVLRQGLASKILGALHGQT